MTIGDLVNSKGHAVITAREEDTVLAVVQLLCDKRIGAVVVCDSAGVMTGVLSERDVVRGLASEGAGVLERQARDIMTSPVVTCAPSHTVQEAMAQMTSRRFRHLPVVAGGALVGVVSIGDLVKSRIEEAEREAEALKNYIVTG